MANDVTNLLKAPEAEPFVGPAIFSGRAAGVFFHEIFGHRVEGHRQKDESEGQTFTKSVGTKVLPDFLSVVFDPTRRKIDGIDLNGWYDYDDEGVKGAARTAVDKGVLKTFLMSRSPIKGFDHSNGHGRRQPGLEVVSRQSNLIVESTNAVPDAKLRQMLIDEVKKQNKPYGLYFRDITGGFTTTAARRLAGLQSDPGDCLPGLPGRPAGRTGARRRYRGHAARELLQDPGHLRQAGSLQRLLRRRIGQRSGLGGVARDPGFGDRNREEGQVERPPAAASRADQHGRQGRREMKRLLAGAASPACRWRWLLCAQAPPQPTPCSRRCATKSSARASSRCPTWKRPTSSSTCVDEEESFSVSASLGGLLSRAATTISARPMCSVRVGDYKFDNTQLRGRRGSGGSRYDLERFPLEDSYPLLRRYLWLETDSAYKSAVEAISRKRAALRNMQQTDQLNDFAHAEPVTSRARDSTS